MDVKTTNVKPWPKQGLSDHVRAAPQPVEPRPSRADAEAAVRTLIAYAGDDPAREGLLDTPKRVIGAKASDLRRLRETVRKMLKENGPPPDGEWADVAVLEPVRDYKARHASTMLTFDAVVDAIGQIEARAREATQDASA